MFDLNGSETDWLVYADYLEDQGKDATHIREGVADPHTEDWHPFQQQCTNVGANYCYNLSNGMLDFAVGSAGYSDVGSISLIESKVGGMGSVSGGDVGTAFNW
jgi:hypothetical protein